MRPPKLFDKAMQRYWRATRALTLGVQAVVLTPAGDVLLVRLTYRLGWHLPGGGVEKHETVEAALARELMEEAGIELDGPPELFGLYANFRAFPNDHVALYVVRRWHQPRAPQPTREIAGHGLFPSARLPEGVNASARRRILEVVEHQPRAPMW